MEPWRNVPRRDRSENISGHSRSLSPAAVITHVCVIFLLYALLIFEMGIHTENKKRHYLIKESPRNGTGNNVALSNGAANFLTKFSPLLNYKSCS